MHEDLVDFKVQIDNLYIKDLKYPFCKIIKFDGKPIYEDIKLKIEKQDNRVRVYRVASTDEP